MKKFYLLKSFLTTVVLTVSALFCGLYAQESETINTNDYCVANSIKAENPLASEFKGENVVISNGAPDVLNGTYITQASNIYYIIVKRNAGVLSFKSETKAIGSIEFTYDQYNSYAMNEADFKVDGEPVDVEISYVGSSNNIIKKVSFVTPVSKGSVLTIAPTKCTYGYGLYGARIAAIAVEYAAATGPQLNITSSEAGYEKGTFSLVELNAGESKSFTFNVKGSDLTNDVTFSSVNNFFTFSPESVTAADAAGENGVDVTATFTVPAESGSASFAVNSDGAESVNMTVNYTLGIPNPELTVTPATVNLGEVFVGFTQEVKFKVAAKYLTEGITFSSEFEGCTFTPESISMDDVAAAAAPIEVTATFAAPAEAGTKNITVSTAGVEAQTIAVTYTTKEPVQPKLAYTVCSNIQCSQSYSGKTLKAGTAYYIQLQIQGKDYYKTPFTIKGNIKNCSVALDKENSIYYQTVLQVDADGNFETESFDAPEAAAFGGKMMRLKIVPDVAITEETAISIALTLCQNGKDIVVLDPVEYTIMPLKPAIEITGNNYTEVEAEYNLGSLEFNALGDEMELTIKAVDFTPVAARIAIAADAANDVITINGQSLENRKLDILNALTTDGKFVAKIKCNDASALNGYRFMVVMSNDKGIDYGTIITVTAPAKPVVTVENPAASLNDLVKGATEEFEFTVKATDLAGDISFESADNFFSFTPATIAKAEMTAEGVKVKGSFTVPTESGEKTFTIKSDYADDVLFTVTYTVLNPVITIDNAEVTVAGEFEAGADVEAKFTVKATDLINDITFEAEGVTFTPAKIAKADMTEAGVEVTASFKAAATVGENTVTIIVNSEGAEPKTVKVKYTVKTTATGDLTDVTIDFNELGQELNPGTGGNDAFAGKTIDGVEFSNETEGNDKTELYWANDGGYVIKYYNSGRFGIKSRNQKVKSVVFKLANTVTANECTVEGEFVIEGDVAIWTPTAPVEAGEMMIFTYNKGVAIKTVTVNLVREGGEPATPVITIDNAEVTVAGEFEAGADVEAKFTVKANDLTNDITFEAAGVTFTPATIAKDEAKLIVGVEVKAAFKAAATVGENTVTITVKSEGAEPETVTVKYTVKESVEPATPVITIDNAEVTVDGEFEAEADVEAKFTVKATDLTADITFEAEGVTFTPATIAKDNADLAAGVEVTAAFKAAATAGEHTVTITVKSEGADSKTVTVKYTVTEETGVENVTVVSTVWSESGMLFIEAAAEAQATVYTLQGQVVETLNLIQGVNTVALPSAVYVVKVGETAVKVSVR